MKKSLSLKQIWTTLVLFVVMVPATIMMSWYGLQLYNNQLNSALMIERQANEILQIQIESEIKRLKTLLKNKSDPFALMIDEIETPSVLMDINTLLGVIIERESAIHEVMILSRQAEALAAVDPGIGAMGDRILSTEEMQAVVDHWEFYTGKEKIAEVIIPSFGREYIGSPRKHEDFIGFTMATPIGKPAKAILVALVDIRKLWSEGSHKHEHGEQYSHDYMLDRRGSLLSEIQNTDYNVGSLMTHLPIARAALVNEEWLSDTPYIGVDKQLVYGTKTEISLLHWTLISEVIASKITQPIWEILFKTFLIALLIMLVLVLSILWLAKKTLKPIEQACEAIAHVAKGNYHFTLQPCGISELDMMSFGFNEMAIARKNAETLLLKREQDLLITLNSIGDAVITTDAEGYVIRMNPVAEKLTGWLLDDAKGQAIKTIFPIIDASTRESIENPVDKVLATGEIVYLTNNTTLISRQGVEYQISDTAAPIVNDNNETIGMVLVFNDVTENYQLRMSEKKMGEIIRLSEQHLRLYREQSPIAMIEWNIDCQVVDWNQAAEELFGYTFAEVKGRSFHDFLLPENAEIQVSEVWQKLISGAGYEASVNKNLTKDGGTVLCEWHNTSLKNKSGLVIGVASLVLDITERQRIDAVLLALAETKGDEEENIFQLIVRQLALSQGVRFALISCSSPTSPQIATTLAIWANDGFIENFSYSLSETARNEKSIQCGCHDSMSIQCFFPEEKFLLDIGVSSCFGVPLMSSDGKQIGVLTLMDDKPIIEHKSTTKLLDILAVRASIELERKLSEEKLQFAARIFSETHEGITITDANVNIIDVNPGFCKITGYSREDVIGKNPGILSSGRQSPDFYAEMWGVLKEKGHWQGEVWNRKKTGELYAQHMTISALLDNKGIAVNYVGLFSDITMAKEQQQSLEFMAHYDVLTNLPNRTLFADRFSQAISHSKRDKSLLAVCFIDLDEFKPVNDCYGHDVGDQVLVGVAQRIKDNIREEDTASRLGGDEFALLLGDIESIGQCQQAMARIHHAIAQPYIINGQAVSVAASSGVTIYPLDDADPDTLIRHADSAMYQAKLAGRNRFHLFDTTQEQQIIRHHVQLKEIETAFSQNEFSLYYQPKVNMQTGKVYGVEALIRWLHPEKGLIPPLDFLPFIEGAKLEIQIGNWVIDAALKQLDAWRKEGINLEVSVNISALHLQWEGFFEQIDSTLARYPEILSSYLQLEILESSILSDVHLISSIIKKCRNLLGVGIALDDFGTGYSSLTHLRHIPVDTIKIDRSFVRDMLNDPGDYAIIEGVIGLAKTFNRKVIAEGVESKDHGLKLMEMGCFQAQGYGIARPMPAEKISTWLNEYKPFEEWAEVSNTPE